MTSTKLLIDPLWREVIKENLIGQEIVEIAKAAELESEDDRKLFYTKVLQGEFKGDSVDLFQEFLKNKPVDTAFVKAFNTFYVKRIKNLDEEDLDELVKVLSIFTNREIVKFVNSMNFKVKKSLYEKILTEKYSKDVAETFVDFEEHKSRFDSAFLLAKDVNYISKGRNLPDSLKRLYETKNKTIYSVMSTHYVDAFTATGIEDVLSKGREESFLSEYYLNRDYDFKTSMNEYDIFGSVAFRNLPIQGHIDFTNSAKTNVKLKQDLIKFYQTRKNDLPHVSKSVVEFKETSEYKKFIDST